MSRSVGLLPRRTFGTLAVTGGLLLATAACDPFSGSADPTPTPSADDLLVTRVSEAILVARTVAADQDHPDLVSLHDAHLSALSADPASSTATASPTSSSAAADSSSQVSVLTAETTLKQTLTQAAGDADSGALARALASMAAAVAQRVTVLK